MLLQLPVKNWLLYAYAIVCPFFAFSVFLDRDTASHWVIALMLCVMLVDFIESGGRVWFDKSMVYLLIFALVYVASTIAILWEDPSNVWAGRTPFQRAIGIDIRVALVVVAFFAFVHHLADAPPQVFVHILKIQFAIGAVVALFGLAQYLSFTILNSDALVGFESTNEAFRTRGNLFRLGKERVFRTSAIFSEPSFFGFFLVPLIVKAILAYYKRIYFGSKAVHGALIGLFILALVSNFSLTAILSLPLLAIGAGAISFKRNPKLVVIALLATGAFIGLLFVSPLGGILVGRLEQALEFRDLSTLARFMNAYVGVLVFADNPIFGVGPGGFAFLYPKVGIFVERDLMHTPLNAWLTFLTDVGIIGFIPFVALLWSILGRGIRRSHTHPLNVVFLWSVVSYLVLLTTVDFWFLDFIWFELALLLALTATPTIQRQTSDVKGSTS